MLFTKCWWKNGSLNKRIAENIFRCNPQIVKKFGCNSYNTYIQFDCIYGFVHYCFDTIIAGNGNALDAGNYAASNTCNSLSPSNTYIHFGCLYPCILCCLNTIVTVTGIILDTGNDAASNACKQCLCILYLLQVWLHICRHPFLLVCNNCRHWKYFGCRQWCFNSQLSDFKLSKKLF